MVMLRISRVVPKLRGLLRGGPTPQLGTSIVVPTCTRPYSRGPFGREPFTQMEEFMKDMERKFRRDIEGTVSSLFRDFPPRLGSPRGLVPREPAFGHVEDVSTENTYKLAFNFTNAKPEDVQVSLKGRNLSVSSKATTETENSKSSYAVVRECTLPEDVELEALESSLSPEGILTVEAPRTAGKGQTSQTIHINREE